MRRGFFSAGCAGLKGQQVMRSVSHDEGDSFKSSRCHVKDLLEHSRSINHCNTRRKTTVPKENHIHRGIQRYRFASRNWESIQQATDAMLFLFSKRNSNICMIKKKKKNRQNAGMWLSHVNHELMLRQGRRKNIKSPHQEDNHQNASCIVIYGSQRTFRITNKLSGWGRSIFQHLIKAPLFMWCGKFS